MSAPLSPSLALLISNAIEARMAELHTGLPARVLKFDASVPCVDVQPLFIRIVLDDEDNELEEHMPEIANVPVIYPGGGGWEITYPLFVGDIVFLAFTERSIDVWLDSAPGQEVDPGHARKHDLSDAIAIPRLRPRTQPGAVSESDLRIGRVDGGDPAIVLKPDGTILVGQGAGQPIPLGTMLQTLLSQLLVLPTPDPTDGMLHLTDATKLLITPPGGAPAPWLSQKAMVK